MQQNVYHVIVIGIVLVEVIVEAIREDSERAIRLIVSKRVIRKIGNLVIVFARKISPLKIRSNEDMKKRIKNTQKS